MGQGSRWAGEALGAVLRATFRLGPLLLIVVLLHLVGYGLGLATGAADATARLQYAIKTGTMAPWSTLGVLAAFSILGAAFQALRITIALLLITPTGGLRGLREGLALGRGRLVATAGAGFLITTLWQIPVLAGIVSYGRGAAGWGLLLTLAGFVVLAFVAGRRYLAMPIALYEGKSGAAAFQESGPRLRNHRRSAAWAVFLASLPPDLGGLVLGRLWGPVVAAFRPSPVRDLVAAIPSLLFVTAQAALLGRVAWQVYRDVGRAETAPAAPPAVASAA